MARSPFSGVRQAAAFAGEHLAALTVAFLFVAPIGWTVLSSFKPAREEGLPPLPPRPTSGVSAEN